MSQTRREKERETQRRTSAKDWANEASKGFTPTAVQLPEGMDWFNVKSGDDGKANQMEVDFMPFLAGKGNPRADEGIEHFERTYHTHRIPTANGKSAVYCCLWECFAVKCPVCEWVNAHKEDSFGSEAETDKHKKFISDIKAKMRHLWLVNNKPGDKSNKLRVFETNDWNKGMGFRELMVDAINSSEKNADFSSLKNGMTAIMTVKQQPAFGKGSKPYDAVTRIDFKARDYSYPSEMLKKNPCLDDMLIPAMPAKLKGKPLVEFTKDDWELCYEELKNRFANGGVDEDEGEKEERKPTSRGVDADDDGDTQERNKKSKKRQEEEDADADDSDVVDSDVADDDDAPPAKKGKKPAADDDDDDGNDSATVDSDTDDPTAKERGIKVGSKVKHKRHGKCDVLKVSGDGTSLTLEDEDGDEFSGIAPSEVELVGKKADAEDDGDDADDDADDPPKGKKAASDDDDDADDSAVVDSDVADEDADTDDSAVVDDDSDIVADDSDLADDDGDKPAKKASTNGKSAKATDKDKKTVKQK